MINADQGNKHFLPTMTAASWQIFTEMQNILCYSIEANMSCCRFAFSNAYSITLIFSRVSGFRMIQLVGDAEYVEQCFFSQRNSLFLACWIYIYIFCNEHIDCLPLQHGTQTDTKSSLDLYTHMLHHIQWLLSELWDVVISCITKYVVVWHQTPASIFD